ncbi:MAG: hypothetical protein OXB88_05740 [Bacteriovoracales bacterium]|nr:hypothetical protein [Bacteriovoracales bacterium]
MNLMNLFNVLTVSALMAFTTVSLGAPSSGYGQRETRCAEGEVLENARVADDKSALQRDGKARKNSGVLSGQTNLNKGGRR